MSRIRVITACLVCMAFCFPVDSHRCGGEASVYGKMLKGSAFMKLASKTPYQCQQACDKEMRCQSFNYLVYREECELNNRTKESRPNDFVSDQERLYMKRYKNRGE